MTARRKSRTGKRAARPAPTRGPGRQSKRRPTIQETVLQDSSALLMAISEGTTDAVFVKDRQGRYVMINSRGARLAGRTVQDFIGRDDTQVFPPEDARRIMEHDRQVMDSGQSATFEETVLVHGTPRIFRTMKNVYRDRQGRVIGLIGTAQDLTDHRQAEQTVREGEARYRAILGSALDCIIMMDHEGRILEFNGSAEATFGYARDEVVGKPMAELLVPAAYRERHRQGVARYLQAGVPGIIGRRVELTAMRADGSEFPIELTVIAIGEGPRPLFTAFIRDITERRRSEQAVLESEARLRAFMENSPAVMFLKDGEGRYLQVNSQFEQRFRLGRRDVLGRTDAEIFSAEQAALFRRHDLEVAGSGRPLIFEEAGPGEGGLRTGIAYRFPLRDLHGAIYATGGIIVDITERKQLEEQYRQSQKMEAIGLLAGGIAHDFNNMLTVIRGHTELMLSRLHKDDVMRGELQEIMGASDRAASLTSQLLAFSRRQHLQLQVLELNAVVTALDSMLRRLIAEDIRLVLQLDPKPSMVKADRGQIEQVLMNLVVNARDAMPRGGTLTIATRHLELDAAFIRSRSQLALKAGGYVAVTVRDTGCGMDPATQARIFEPFFTTKEQGVGTGLGLATVYGIVTQSGGLIEAESEVGRGSTFTVYLPHVAERTDAAAAGPATALLPRSAETILVVEDEDMVRRLARRILSEQGYTVLDASQGDRAQEVCAGYHSKIHLLLTDLVMPGINGRELAARLRAERPDLKVLYMSGYQDNVLHPQPGEPQKELPFIHKPFTPTSLMRKVREVLDAPTSDC